MSNLKCKKWTDEEKEFAVKNIFKLPQEELEKKLGRNIETIKRQLQKLTKNGKIGEYNRPYTEYEDEILFNSYGVNSIETLQMIIYRTEASIRSRLYRLTGDCKVNTISGNYTVSDLSTTMGYTQTYIRKLIKKTDIPFIKVNGVFVIEFESFWSWIENNTKYINASNIDYDDLYHCPKWYIDKVNELKKELSNSSIKKGTWTMHEITLAKHLKNKGYNNIKIAEELNRNSRSVKEMFARLKNKNNLKLIN